MFHEKLNSVGLEVLSQLMLNSDVCQVFVFSEDGELFLPGRTPINDREMQLLKEALSLLERIEPKRQKPFGEIDSGGQFSVASISPVFELYIVCLWKDKLESGVVALKKPNSTVNELRCISVVNL